MSFRNHWLHHWLRAVLVLAGTGPLSPAWAEDPAPAGTPPAAPPAECRDLDGKLLGAVDCLELEARFATLAKIAEAKSKIEEARAKAAEAEKKRAAAEQREPPPLPGKPPDAALAPPLERGRVLEILGPEARLRWGGGEYRVRAGQLLPGGARIVQVSLEGVTVAQGTRRETLPFVMGGAP
jgi:type IV pilus biogenesis protein PilP